MDDFIDLIDFGNCGDSIGAIVADTLSAIRAANSVDVTLRIVLAGYSHGAGLAFLVSRELDSLTGPQQLDYDVVLSSYIDAVTQPREREGEKLGEAQDRMPEYYLGWFNPGTLDPKIMVPERRLPYGSQYHLNLYQSSILYANAGNTNRPLEPFGNSTKYDADGVALNPLGPGTLWEFDYDVDQEAMSHSVINDHPPVVGFNVSHMTDVAEL